LRGDILVALAPLRKMLLGLESLNFLKKEMTSRNSPASVPKFIIIKNANK